MADSFGTVRLVAAAPRCRNVRVALRVDNHAQADFDAVVKCLGVGQAQVDATVAATPLVRLGVIEALVVLPGGIVEADHVALKRHPVAYRALVFGLAGLGSLAPMSLLAPSLLLICHTPSGWRLRPVCRK